MLGVGVCEGETSSVACEAASQTGVAVWRARGAGISLPEFDAAESSGIKKNLICI